MHDRLVVTSDAGRPWEVDPESLVITHRLAALTNGTWLFQVGLITSWTGPSR